MRPYLACAQSECCPIGALPPRRTLDHVFVRCLVGTIFQIESEQVVDVFYEGAGLVFAIDSFPALTSLAPDYGLIVQP